MGDQYWFDRRSVLVAIPLLHAPPTSLYNKHLQTLHFSPPDRPSFTLLHRAREEALTIGIVWKFG